MRDVELNISPAQALVLGALVRRGTSEVEKALAKAEQAERRDYLSALVVLNDLGYNIAEAIEESSAPMCRVPVPIIGFRDLYRTN